eukprot:TRINITY_DN105848_c0_g1_i1.p1 TRINITY_DN105848_c0_g1~~TRINITY_DN105848_c0_g1_i1.p1  ORF type:complete len:565 (-),score=71.75 TRINITY_DN105848_c0_g1_i1:125-1819(-)
MPHPPYAEGMGPGSPVRDASLEYLQRQLMSGGRGSTSSQEPTRREASMQRYDDRDDNVSSDVEESGDTQFVPLRHSLQSSDRFRPPPSSNKRGSAPPRVHSQTPAERQNRASLSVPQSPRSPPVSPVPSRASLAPAAATNTGSFSFGHMARTSVPTTTCKSGRPSLGRASPQSLARQATAALSPRRRASDGFERALPSRAPICGASSSTSSVRRPAPPSPRAVAKLLSVPLTQNSQASPVHSTPQMTGGHERTPIPPSPRSPPQQSQLVTASGARSRSPSPGASLGSSAQVPSPPSGASLALAAQQNGCKAMAQVAQMTPQQLHAATLAALSKVQQNKVPSRQPSRGTSAHLPPGPAVSAPRVEVAVSGAAATSQSPRRYPSPPRRLAMLSGPIQADSEQLRQLHHHLAAQSDSHIKPTTSSPRFAWPCNGAAVAGRSPLRMASAPVVRQTSAVLPQWPTALLDSVAPSSAGMTSPGASQEDPCAKGAVPSPAEETGFSIASTSASSEPRLHRAWRASGCSPGFPGTQLNTALQVGELAPPFSMTLPLSPEAGHGSTSPSNTRG